MRIDGMRKIQPREEKSSGRRHGWAWLWVLFVLLFALPVTAWSADLGEAVLYAPEGAEPAPVAESKPYTVMIYMIGSNLESRLGNATKDMMEMEQSGVDFDRVNVLVYTGGSRRWVGNVQAGCNGIYDLSLPQNERMVACTQGNANMGAPETLCAFLTYAKAHYPAEHYGLILWDHGGGPLWGYGNDELFDADSLLLEEMDKALADSPFGGENKLDWVGFDACLMGSLECMSVWEPYASYYIASEELEPGDGWDYHFLKTLGETTDPLEIAESIIHSYGAYYEANKSDYYNPDVTLSCADLSALDGVWRALGTLSEALSYDLAGGGYSRIQQVRADTKSFGLLEDSKGEEDFSYDLVDLMDLARGLSGYFPESGALLQEQLDALIPLQYANIPSSSGVTLYYPSRNKEQYAQMGYDYQALGGSQAYLHFLDGMTDTWMSGSSRDWDLGRPSPSGDGWSLTLTPEQQADLAMASVTILCGGSDGTFYPVLSDVRVYPDENGTLTLPADPEVIALRTGEEAPQLWCVTMMGDQDGREMYRTDNTRLNSTTNLYNHGLSMQTREISVMMSAPAGAQRLEINAVSEAAGADLGGKNTIDADRWECVYQSFPLRIPMHDDLGRMKIVRGWADIGMSSFEMVPIEGSFWFEKVPISALGETFYFQFQIEDTRGERYGAEVTPLSPGSIYEVVQEDTPAGTLTWHLYGDHACLYGYDGTDEEIILPEEVRGLPVTRIEDGAFARFVLFSSAGYTPVRRVTLPRHLQEIGFQAFYACMDLEEVMLPEDLTQIGAEAFCACTSLEEVTLPDGVTSIGRGAFAGCTSLEQVTLPSGLEALGAGVFAGCTSLQEIRLAQGCSGVREEGGAILSADGTCLLAFPCMQTGSYTVPEGVEKIAYGAFEGSGLEEVILPEGLLEIDNYAFYDASALQMPALPDTLKVLGAYAFGAGWYSTKPEEKEEAVIEIGSHLEQIGEGAFDEMAKRRFAVKNDNPRFSAREGCLTNKAGDTICALAADGTNVAVVPEGIVTIDWTCLTYLNTYDLFDFDDPQLYLPESLVNLPAETPDQALTLQIHAPAGSVAQQYCRLHELHYDTDTARKAETVRVEDETGSWTFRLSEDHAVLTAYEGSGGQIVVPRYVSGLPVTVIGNGEQAVFSGNGIQALEIPEGVRELGDAAIALYGDLTVLSLPSTLERIGSRALGLGYDFDPEDLAVPEGVKQLGSDFSAGAYAGTFPVTGDLIDVAPDAFADCLAFSGFESREENEIYQVRGGALYLADGETLVTCPAVEGIARIPEGTRQIGPRAFAGWSRLVQVQIPQGVERIGAEAFRDCDRLETVSLPDGVTQIGDWSFSGCLQLSSITLGTGLKRIGAYAFAYCEALEEADLPEGLEEIEEQAFYGTGLRSISLPQTTTYIGRAAFGRPFYAEPAADSAKRIEIGPEVSHIGEEAFTLLALEEYVVSEENLAYASVEGFLTDKGKELIYEGPWALQGEIFIPEGITAILGVIVPEESAITDVYLPESVAYLSESAISSDWEEVTDEQGMSDYEMVYKVVLHAPPGSSAQRYAQTYGIPYEAWEREQTGADPSGDEPDQEDGALLPQDAARGAAALDTYQFLTRLLGGNIDFAKVSSWGESNPYKIRWALTTNGFQIGPVADSLLQDQGYADTLLLLIVGNVTDQDVDLAEVLASLEEAPTWQQAVEAYRADPEAFLSRLDAGEEPSGFDTLIGLHALEDTLSARIIEAGEEAPGELSLYRALRLLEYTGLRAYYEGGREEAFLQGEMDKLRSASLSQIPEAGTYAPVSAGPGSGPGDFIVFLDD